jgi:Papain-like cysteine protease AvrRpt2
MRSRADDLSRDCYVAPPRAKLRTGRGHWIMPKGEKEMGMSEYILKVPLVGQKSGYDGKPLVQPNAHGRMQQHGFMACWYASACMVSYYYKAGPRLGLPPVWKADQGLTVQAIDLLARAEGLKAVPKPDGGLTADNVISLLKAHGPIWAAGRFLDGFPQAGHAIVLSGVREDHVFYNDPWEPKAKQRPWQWINVNLLPLHNALLAKDTSRS